MPELPEVQTIVSDLDEFAPRTPIKDVQILCKTVLANISVKSFVKEMKGEVIDRVTRRAKYIIIHFRSGKRVIVHLRMTGQLLLRKSGSTKEKHLRVIINFGEQQIRFNNMRRFGRFYFLGANENFKNFDKLGPEPLENEFSFEYFANLVNSKDTNIKKLLLDQTLIAGIGNIYCDESLFDSKIKPHRKTKSLTKPEQQRLHRSIKKTLKMAVDLRGTSSQNYLDAIGKAGEFQNILNVYKQKGKPCKTCKTPINYTKIAGRGTHFCPQCQK